MVLSIYRYKQELTFRPLYLGQSNTLEINIKTLIGESDVVKHVYLSNLRYSPHFDDHRMIGFPTFCDYGFA